MAREAAKIIAGVCSSTMALTAPLAWAAPPLDVARDAVAAATATSATAASAAAPPQEVEWSGWTRREGTLTREGWSLRATRLERTESGWLARGDASLSGPRGVYVRASRVELDDVKAHALATDEAPASLVGEGWTIEGKRIEIDLERARARVLELGSTRDEAKR